MPKAIKPLPISGQRVKVTAGKFKGREGIVDAYYQGRLHINSKTRTGWAVIGPINPAHTEEIPG